MTARRRYVIAAGAAQYDYLLKDQQLPSVNDDVKLVSSWFVRHGFEHVLSELGESPTLSTLRNGLGDWFGSDHRTPYDIVILYYSGHGEDVPGDAHYLLTRDSRFNNAGLLTHTALADEELARVVANSQVQHALIVLDTCYSGRGIAGFSAKASTLLARRGRRADAPFGIYLLAASRPGERAHQHVFAPTLIEVLDNRDQRAGGAAQVFLDPPAVIWRVNASFERHDIRQRAHWMAATPLPDNLSELLPNPNYGTRSAAQQAAAGAPVIDPQLRMDAGEEAYFSGRERAVAELTQWLSAPPDGRARVITGGPGTGKSALFRRVVQLAGDPAATVVMDARGKMLADVRDAIAAAIGKQVTTVRDLTEKIAAQETPLLVALDGLDESHEARKIATALLRELAPIPSLHLLVASRPEGPARVGTRRVMSLGSATVEIDLDDTGYLGPRDVEAFVAHWLLASDEPHRYSCYRGHPDRASEVARAVADRAGLVFLVAVVVARNLAAAEAPLDPAVADWESLIPRDVGPAFQQYLDRFDESGSDLSTAAVIDLLRPLAYAEGEGLPRVGASPLWANTASSLAGKEYVDDDVSVIMREAGAYIVEVQDQGRSAYRLYHEVLAAFLRSPGPAEEMQKRFVDALVASVPVDATSGRRNWSLADGYVRRYLATHAAAADTLADLVTDPMFMAAADPGHLLPLLPSIEDPDARAAAQVYVRASYHLRTKLPDERLAYLEMAALQRGLTAFARRIHFGNSPPAWRALWAPLETDCPHRRIGEHQGTARAIALCQVSGIPAVVSGGVDGVRVFSTVDGTPLGARGIPNVWAVSAARVAGADVILLGCLDGTIRIWDPLRGC